VASLSQGRTAAAQCGLFTHKSVPVIFEPPCTFRMKKMGQKTQESCSFLVQLFCFPNAPNVKHRGPYLCRTNRTFVFSGT